MLGEIARNVEKTIQGIVASSHDACYSQREDEENAIHGCCGGLAGGDASTHYLQADCIGCSHLVLPDEVTEGGDE